MKLADVDANRGWWLRTYKPTMPFYINDPRVEEIDIKNIAWSLSMQCRFNGYVKKFYSVAQHSVLVSEIVESEHPFDNKLIFRALMHDAPEAYIGDIVTPVKKQLDVFYEIEDKIDRVICEKYDMAAGENSCVKKADVIALVTESRDLQCGESLEKIFDVAPLDSVIEAWTQEEGYQKFLERYEDLQYRIGLEK